MTNFQIVELIEDYYHKFSKWELAKMLVEKELESEGEE